MKVTYRQAARDDLIRQFRYYHVQLGLPEIAVRFKDAVRETARTISRQPQIAQRYPLRNQNLRNLRSWPVSGFEVFRLYFLVDNETMRVIRILHGKRNVRAILEREKPSE